MWLVNVSLIQLLLYSNALLNFRGDPGAEILNQHTRDFQVSEWNIYVSLRLRVQNAVSAQPCVGKFRISLVLLNFLHCNFRLWFETP